MTTLCFPFGQPITAVRQTDRTRKRVFVLGVYASAVHARWLGVNGKPLVNALAVASEPCIFWTGTGAAEIISAIPVRPGAGSLVPANASLNGPSGKILDSHYLAPLGLTRADTWLCDLLPESRLNAKQVAALKRAHYPELAQEGLVPPVDLDAVAVRDEFLTNARPAEILAEIAAAQPDVLVTLGDQPIKDFIGPQAGITQRSVRALGDDAARYGRFHQITLGGRTMKLLPLVHPRQAGALGAASPVWTKLHAGWVAQVARDLLAHA
jgi:hypothetical protein